MSQPPQAQLSGVRKAAIVVMALGEENSSKLFKHLQEDEIERIVREVAALGTVPPEHSTCNTGSEAIVVPSIVAPSEIRRNPCAAWPA